jgi:3-methylcrotonyl-CoA carboxylase beta subunit
MGMPVGIIANNGVLFSESAVKGAHFVELCSQRKIPLVFLQNITGFMVGKIRGRRHRQGRRQAGDGGRDHQGAEDHHDRRRLVRRGQLRHVRAGLFAALPVDLAEQPHLGDGRRTGGRRAGHRQARRDRAQGRQWSSEDEAEFKRPTLEMFERQSHPLYASARLWDDGIIDPRKTREILALSLSAALNAPVEDTKFGVFRM